MALTTVVVLTRLKSIKREVLVLTTVSCFLFALGALLEILATTEDAAQFSMWIMVCGIVVTPLFMYFVQQYSEQYLPKFVNILLFATAFLLMLLTWTSHWHGLIYSDIYILDVPYFSIFNWTRQLGVLFPFLAIHPTLCVLCTLIVLIRKVRNSGHMIKTKIITLIVFAIIPAVAQIPTITTFNIPRLQYSMLFIVVVNIFVYFWLYRHDLLENEKEREVVEINDILIKTSPFIMTIWDEDGNIIKTSHQAIKVFELENEREFINRFYEFCAETQACGTLSAEKVQFYIKKVLCDGYAQFEWMLQDQNGEPLPTEVTAVRYTKDGKNFVIAHTVDLRILKANMEKEHKLEEIIYDLEMKQSKFKVVQAEAALEHREALLNTVNHVAVTLLTIERNEDFSNILLKCMQSIGNCVKADNVTLLRMSHCDDGIDISLAHQWVSETGQHVEQMNFGRIPRGTLPVCEELFFNGDVYNGPIIHLPPTERILIDPQCAVVSFFAIPIFVNSQLWGVFSLGDYKNERTLSTEEMDILRSAGFMISSTYYRIEQEAEIHRIEIAEESSKAKSRFLARMSHEIRTPITAVLGISEIQLQDPNLSSQVEESFAKIHRSAELLLNIVNDLLDLSKFEAGKMKLFEEEYNIVSLISDLTYLPNSYIGDKDIEFLLNISAELPSRLKGDTLHIGQVVNNLLSNAFKYTESGTVEMSLSHQKTDNQATLVVSIRDTGYGMTKEQVKTLLYDEYVRFHEQENRHIGGTGLGLAIVSSLLQLMGGHIKVESEVNIGTCVTVFIPQKIVDPKQIGEEVATRLEQLSESELSVDKRYTFKPEQMPYGKVLVVDDVEVNLYVAKGLLAFYDLTVDVCNSGYEAIELIKQGKEYDIVFMDQMMPDLTGTETMQKMRDIGYQLPIVALTADAVIGQAEEFMRKGFDGFISKPIQTKQLNTIVVKHIRDKQPPEILDAVKPTQDNTEGMRKCVNNCRNTSELENRLRQDFALRQKNTVHEICRALDAGNLNKAHLLTHSLKGLAGLIHENVLMQISAIVEQILINGDIPHESLMVELECELERVLEGIKGSSVIYAQSGVDFNPTEAIDLLNTIQPLLKTRNADCQKYISELIKIPETAVLVKLIEEWEFSQAEQVLEMLKDILPNLTPHYRQNRGI